MGIIGLVFASGVLALVFCGVLAVRILKNSEGTDKMKEIAGFIKSGAQSYLNQQYKVVGTFFIVLFVIMYLIGLKIISVAFLAGGFCSALCGWIGMRIATNSSARTAYAAKTSLNAGLRVAFSAGTVMGLAVVGIAIVYLAGGFVILKNIPKTL